MAVGTGGGAGGNCPPPPTEFGQPKKFKNLQTTTYKSLYSNKANICS